MLALPFALLTAATACGDDDDASTGGGDKVTLGVLAASAEEDYAKQLGIKAEPYQTVPDLFEALEAKRIDALALTQATVKTQTEDMDGFEATKGFIPEIDGEEQVGCGGFAFRHEDQVLRDAFSREIHKMQDGDEILPIVEEFGFTEQEVSEAVDRTAAEFAGGEYDDLTESPEDDAALEPYRNKELVLGVAGERPYGYEDENGEVTGAAPELARKVFENLGITQVKFISTSFDGLISGLNAKQMDVTAAGMFINPERAKEVLFADPDYCAYTSFAVPEGNPAGLETFEDLLPKE